MKISGMDHRHLRCQFRPERIWRQHDFRFSVMKLLFATSLRLAWASYLILTSVYCFLAFLPYTYYALIKAPPYPWIPWFAAHHVLLGWLALAAGAVGFRPASRNTWYTVSLGILVACWLVLTFRPFLTALENTWVALAWSVASLLLLLLSTLPVVVEGRPAATEADRQLLAYSRPIWVAVSVWCLGLIGSQMGVYRESGFVAVHLTNMELWMWSLITQVTLVIVAVTLLNLLKVVASKTPFPQLLRWGTIFGLALVATWLAGAKFLENTLSAPGWAASLYAATLAATVTCAGVAVVAPITTRFRSLEGERASGRRRAIVIGIISMLGVAALVAPSAIAEQDWNGVMQVGFTVALWVGLSACFFLLLPLSKTYSVPALLAVLLVTACSYKSLQATEFLWGKPLGDMDSDIARSMELYATGDTSFRLADHLLGNGPKEELCGSFCHILRQYTNLRNAQITRDISLVDHLSAATGDRPNIFVVVIDSLRPDYLGAYNSKADFSPNIDAFARDSVVFHRAYTEYAGTTLSEPAIWSGALLLHAHYVQPFSKINNLEKLVRADGYQMVLSYDTVLKQLLSPSDPLTKLDTDKALWHQVELCSTADEFAHALDARSDQARPVFFYTQSMNVHQRNHALLADTTRRRPGFSMSVLPAVQQVDGCLGKFFDLLKARGMYDNSIIILTSDHGDATGELGRRGHALFIYPEIMHVPLIVHLPKAMQGKLLYDAESLSTLTDITPTLYYLLGHRPLLADPAFGRSLFGLSKQELESHRRKELFLASDLYAAYGILAENGRFLYVTYDSPARSFLFDLAHDPDAQHSILTDQLKHQYDQRVIDYLRMIGDLYGYKPGISSLLASDRSELDKAPQQR
jgi:hypothetical protein